MQLISNGHFGLWKFKEIRLGWGVEVKDVVNDCKS